MLYTGLSDCTLLSIRGHTHAFVLTHACLMTADRSNHAIRAVDLTTSAVTTLAGLKGTSGSTDGNGESQFWSITSAQSM